MPPEAAIDQIRPCAALMRLRPGVISPEAIRAILGDVAVGTLNEVAREFGVSPNTVKQSWRAVGMPGEQGSYPLGEILAWRLEYEATLTNGMNRFANASDKELARKEKEAEVRKLELQAERLEREEEMARGELVQRSAVVGAFSAMFAVLSESLTSLPDKLTPRFPEHMAVECTETLRRDIERHLIRLSESSEKAIARLSE